MRSTLMTGGLEKAPHRSLLYALGLTREEMKRPLVGVVNSANEVVPGHIHLGQLAKAVKAGVRLAGGTPLEFPAIAVCDGLAMNHAGMRFSLPSREIIADSIEIMATAHPFDALVLIPNCDKVVPGMLMAMLRLNIPAVLVSGGPMLAGATAAGPCDLMSVFEAVGKVRLGEMDQEALEELEESACPGCGSCSGMFTANSMNCLSESIGLALPGNGTIPAVTAARVRLAKTAGMKVMELLERNIRPRDIVTEKSVQNAVTMDMALGCSTNTVLHLPAIFAEAGLDLTLDIFDAVSRVTPNLCKLSPAGHHHIEDLHRARGIPAVMSALAGRLDLSVMTVTGHTLGENLKALKAAVRDPDVIRADAPYSEQGGIAVMRGNLAPDGAVVKQSGRGPGNDAPHRERQGVRVRGGGLPGHPGRQDRGRGRGGHPLRGAPGRAGHARDALAHGGHHGPGPGGGRGPSDRRSLLRGHARRGHRAHLARGRGRRPHRPGGERRQDRHRHPEPPPGPAGGRGHPGQAPGRLDPA